MRAIDGGTTTAVIMERSALWATGINSGEPARAVSGSRTEPDRIHRQVLHSWLSPPRKQGPGQAPGFAFAGITS